MTTELKIPVECYSRVVGFFRPVSHWNLGKQEEFSERVTYKIPEAAEWPRGRMI